MGGGRGTRWSAEEDARLRDLIAAGASHTLMAAKLARSTTAIRMRIMALRRLSKTDGGPAVTMPRWTPNEDERLRRLMQEGRGVVVISERLKRSENAVMARARSLGIPLRSKRRRPAE